MGAPAALEWSIDTCTIGRAMEILGEKWTIVVLREVFNGIRRFDDMRVRTGIPRQVLTNRLTAKGFDLYPVMIAVAAWGDRHLAEPEGPPLEFVHRDCGSPVHMEIHCADGHPVTEPRAVLPRPGPGARRR